MTFRIASLLPWRVFVVPTSLAPGEAADLLARTMGETRVFRGTRIDAAHFEISRVIDYRNSFLPVIHVRFEPGPEGALVRVDMRLNLAILIFSFIWMTIATLGGVVCVVQVIAHGHPQALIGLILPLFGALLIGGGFAYEAARAETLLREMFPARL